MSDETNLLFRLRPLPSDARSGQAPDNALGLPASFSSLAAAHQESGAHSTLHATLGALARQRRLLISPTEAAGVSFVPYSEEAYRTLLEQTPDDVVLSRFVLMRPLGDGGMILESPLAHGHLEIENQTIVASLAAGMAGDRRARLSSDASPALAFVLRALKAAGFSASSDDAGPADWEFHDLLFHARTRMGRHSGEIGATFRLADRGPPSPPYKAPAAASPSIPLPRPDPHFVANGGPPLGRAMTQRRSLRTPGPAPLTVTQLGFFLYLTARSDGVWTTPIGEFTKRPYPSGGGAYEFEIYVLANRLAGATRGAYHYDPTGHALEPLETDAAVFDSMLQDAFASCAQSGYPDVLFVFASRFRRLSWKSSAMAYATTLKNVGALYAVMYLVATALGLRPCALGLGNTESFARLTGTDYHGECSVGEFMLSGAA